MMRIFVLITFLGIFSTTSFQSCKQTREASDNDSDATTLAIISQNPGKFKDLTIWLEGTFWGWSGNDCRYIQNHAHQLTRSDWTFRDDSGGCIFVTAGKPNFLNSAEKSDLGTKIRLNAQVKVQPDNKIYLQYISAERK